MAPLQTLKEESDADSMASAARDNAKTESDGVMKATLTDVQKAIEQLGRNDQDGGASFTFASYREGDNTDRDTDRETDTETDKDADGDTWHKGARHNLAEKARAAVEKEKIQQGSSRAIQPPIDVEVSDESEAEDDHAVSPIMRDHPRIAEEEEGNHEETGLLPATVANASSLSIPAKSQELEVKISPVDLSPPALKSDSQIPTARQDHFPISLEQSIPVTPKEHTSIAPSASMTSPWSPISSNISEVKSPVFDSDVPPPSAISPSQSSQAPMNHCFLSNLNLRLKDCVNSDQRLLH